MRRIVITIMVAAVVISAYLLGPRFPQPVYSTGLPTVAINTSNVARYVDSIENSHKLLPDTRARIVWFNDSLKNKTNFVVLYLHGYGACWYEGSPVNTQFAKAIGANLYLSRLYSHGIDTSEPLIDMYPQALYQSAKEALLIAHSLGNKVIVMSTSTGGTLALKLAADYPDLVNSLILFSPNIAINNPATVFLNKPWGLQVARLSGKGSLYRQTPSKNETEKHYWYQYQRWESAIYLQQLIETTMTPKTFNAVKQPVFLGYYYKNKKEQDPVVKVSAMLKMYQQLGTPPDKKEKVAFPEAGTHVIGCAILSHSASNVENEIEKFFTKAIN